MSNTFQNTIVIHPKTRKALIDAKGLFDFLSSPGVCAIPEYQRPYSWDKDNVGELLDDVYKCSLDGREWFLGPIFTCESEEDEKEKTFEILDGQQRITTLMILLRQLYVFEFSQENFRHAFVWKNKENKTDQDLYDECNKAYKFQKNRIQECISILGENAKKPRVSKFHTDKSVREEFNRFIEKAFDEIKEHKDWGKTNHLEASSKTDFLQTKKNINSNIEFINKYLKDKFIVQTNGFKLLNNFINTLLNSTYLIQIPLYNKSSVLDIFESINNRGKRLRLSDTLRFKSIKSCTSSEDKLKKISSEWHQIYKSLDDSNIKQLFSNSDEFFERYLNSRAGKGNGYTSDSARDKKFTELFQDDYLKGVREISSCLSTIIYFFDFEKGYCGDLMKKSSSKRRDMKAQVARKIILLLKNILVESKNSQIAFLGMITHSLDENVMSQIKQDNQLQFNLTLDRFFELIKACISVDIFQNLRSNERRNVYIKVADFYLEESSLTRTSKIHELKNFNSAGIENLSNLSFHQSNKSGKNFTKIILSYYQCLINIEDSSTVDLTSELELEHTIPESWHTNGGWKIEFENKSECLDNALSIVKDEKVKKALENISSFDNFWGDANVNDTNSFVQLIGNKFFIDGKLNSVLSNKYWLNHQSNSGLKGKKELLSEHFSEANKQLIPSNKKYWEEEEFNLTTIFKRTEDIVTTILDSFKTSFGNLWNK